MWADIILSLATSVSEAICVKFLEKRKIKRFNKRMNDIVKQLFDEFADSSLDSDEFARIIESKPFKEMLRNFFYSIRDGLSCSEYMNRFETYLCGEGKRLKAIEVRRFINKCNELYKEYLHKIIEDNYELNAVVQTLMVSQRDILSKIVESEVNLNRYIKSLDKSNITISNKEIIMYHDNCKSEFGKVRFTGISGAEDRTAQDLDLFYVENTFSYYSKEIIDMYQFSSEKMEVLGLSNFFEYGNKVVLVGAAGLGKSTTLNYLFCNYEKLFDTNALKLKIDLKEYAKDITDGKKDILWCLSTEFYKRIKRTKLQFVDVERILGEYLDKGECLVILDALDEIPSQPMRNVVRDAISNFCQIYFLNRFVISTREVGYLRNKFDESFLHIKINEFNNEQIKKYSQNWFITNYDKGEFKSFWEKFDAEVEKSKCQRLIRNPIVLILALVIFDIEKNLPNRRVVFYKKCIETFLVVREDRKAAFEMTEKFKNILGDDLVVPKIAHYKFEHVDEDPGYRFTNEEVKNAVMEAIEVPDKINWREAVKQYTSYLIDRTELLGEIDEDYFDFAHKTFYEYFLAVYFSREMEQEELVDLLNQWIGDSNNDELARLIVEVVIEKNEPRQHKFIIDFLFEHMIKEASRWSNDETKETDIFLILAELYRNNMLLPKFHERYYRFILHHSDVVYKAERRGGMIGNKTQVEYDVNILVQYFIEELQEKENFNKIIDSVYFLNGEFKCKVVNEVEDELFLYILKLFTWVHNNVDLYNNNDDKKSCDELFDYFMRNQLELTLSCPQIFMSLVDSIVLQKKEEYIPQLFNYKFEANSVFYNYTNPNILFALLDLAYKSDEGFLLFLISMIDCAKECTNLLLYFIFRSARAWGEEVEQLIKERYHKAITFWKLMNDTSDTEQFKEKIRALSVYNPKYDAQYERLFNKYRRREQKLWKELVIEAIESFNQVSKGLEKK